MDPISGVTLGASGGASSLRPTAASGRGAGQVNAFTNGPQAAPAGSTTMSSSIAQISSEVTELLRSIGGGVENDKMLRMLIAIMILMALLEGSQGGSESRTKALGDLPGGAANRPAVFSLYHSSTTISIEQSTTVFVAGPTASDLGGNAQVMQSPGSQIDLTI